MEDGGFLDRAAADGLTSLSRVIRHFRRESPTPKRLPPSPVVFPQAPSDWAAAERLPQAAGGRLNHYRIRAEPTDGNFYAYHNDDVPYPVASLHVDIPRSFRQEAAFERMRDEIQAALERYYAILDETEEDWT